MEPASTRRRAPLLPVGRGIDRNTGGRRGPGGGCRSVPVGPLPHRRGACASEERPARRPLSAAADCTGTGCAAWRPPPSLSAAGEGSRPRRPRPGADFLSARFLPAAQACGARFRYAAAAPRVLRNRRQRRPRWPCYAGRGVDQTPPSRRPSPDPGVSTSTPVFGSYSRTRTPRPFDHSTRTRIGEGSTAVTAYGGFSGPTRRSPTHRETAFLIIRTHSTAGAGVTITGAPGAYSSQRRSSPHFQSTCIIPPCISAASISHNRPFPSCVSPGLRPSARFIILLASRKLPMIGSVRCPPCFLVLTAFRAAEVTEYAPLCGGH